MRIPRLGRPGKNTSFRFVVIGAGRGGTSLLAGLLDAHTRLSVGQERFALDYLLGKAIPTGKDSLRKRVELFRKACEQESRSYPYWGNKITSEQIAALGEAPGAVEGSWQDYVYDHLLRDKKIIYIARDGRSCVRSKMERTGQSYETALARWKYSAELFFYLKERRADITLIRMEELVQDPEGVLKGVCSFLNIAYENGMLGGTANEKMKAEYRQKGFDHRVLETGDAPAEWYRDMREELEAWGYGR